MSAALPVLIVRPEPGNAATLAAARAAGLDAHGFPLFEPQATAWRRPDPDAYDALLLGSAAALRSGGELAGLRRVPVLAVGEATAAAAREAGFAVAATGRGGLQALLDTVAPGARLLRLAGEAHVPLAPPAGVAVDTRVVYRMAPLPLPEAAVTLLRGGAVALLHSGEAAERFAAECDRRRLERARIALACLAPRVATAAGPGWARIEAASTAADAALLALAGRMCESESWVSNSNNG